MLLMLLTALLILANASGVSAGTSGSSAIDPDRKGSLTIRYYEDVMERKPAAGACFTIYRIAGMDEEGSYVNLVRGAEIPLSASPAELLGTVRAAYGMTSNVGAQTIVDPKKLGFGARDDAAKDYERMKDGVMLEYWRGRRNSWCSGGMRRYQEEHRWRRRPAGQ